MLDYSSAPVTSAAILLPVKLLLDGKRSHGILRTYGRTIKIDFLRIFCRFLVLWPLPVTSSISKMSPAPNRRFSPRDVSISISPARRMINWRWGAVWKSWWEAGVTSRDVTYSELYFSGSGAIVAGGLC